MGEIAAEGPTVADRRVADEAARLGHDGNAAADQLRALDGVLPRESADGHAAVVLTHVGEVGEPVDVDDDARMGEPEVQHRDQALAAGQDLRLIPVVMEVREGFVERAGGEIVESGRLHWIAPQSSRHFGRASLAADLKGHVWYSAAASGVKGKLSARARGLTLRPETWFPTRDSATT